MLTINREYHLGIKSFIVSSLRNVFGAIVMFFVALFLSIVSGFFIQIINTLINGQETSGGSTFNSAPLVFLGISLIFLLSFTIFIVGLIISWLSYINFTFNLKDLEIKLKKGILNKEEISIPYHQATDVHVDRDIMYRLFGVSRLVINTAGEDDTGTGREEATFDPIDKEIAEQLQIMLQPRIGVLITEERK
ncbi:MAG: PH domain-containing protein [Candidatus Paceibacterota bacterium]